MSLSRQHNISLDNKRLLYCPLVILLSLVSWSLIVPVSSPPLIIPVHLFLGWWSRIWHGYIGWPWLAILWALVFTNVWSVSVWWGTRMVRFLILSHCLNTGFKRVRGTRVMDYWLLRLAPPTWIDCTFPVIISHLFLSSSDFSEIICPVIELEYSSAFVADSTGPPIVLVDVG